MIIYINEKITDETDAHTIVCLLREDILICKVDRRRRRCQSDEGAQTLQICISGPTYAEVCMIENTVSIDPGFF